MKTWLRLTLVTMTVGGGFMGVVLTLNALLQPFFSSQSQKPVNMFVLAVFLALNVGVTASGILFVHDPSRISPLIAALAIQVPSVSSALIGYRLVAGLGVILSVSGPTIAGDFGVRLGWAFFFGNSWAFSIFQKHPFSLGINLWALALLILLWRSAQRPAPVTHPTSSSTGDESDSAAVVISR